MIRGLIDIRPVFPLVETLEFQSLGYKYQLGLTYLVYPLATHTRKIHSFGAYDGTKQQCRQWLELGMITREEADALCAYALYHDIGHYAFSHVTELFFDISHKQRGINILEKYKNEVGKCNINYDLLVSFLKHENPLHLLVSDKNLGMEKLDYLERDGLVTLGKPGAIEYLRPHIYWIEGKLVIDEKAVDEAKKVQDFYAQMFKNVYLIKCSLIAQRDFQRMVYMLIKSGGINKEDLVELDDSELFGRLSVAKDQKIRTLYKSFKQRNLFTEAIVFRYNDFIHVERTGQKKIKVCGLDNNLMSKIVTSPILSDQNQEALLNIESKIAVALNLQPEDILVVTVVSADRFKTQDISILTSDGGIASLRERYPGHFSDLAEAEKAYMALRICSRKENREKLYQNYQLIKDIVLDTIR